MGFHATEKDAFYKPEPTEKQIEAAAKALREHDMKGRITRPWEQLPNSDAKKWRIKASIALWAARGTE